jgi:maltose alpha-D-glucosyltransferase/alpha-amylase
MFNFMVSHKLFYALASTDSRLLVKALNATRPATAEWGTFLRNHAELDLGRLMGKQRNMVFDAFGPAELM